ncbi:MAG: undecaprenyl-diphosphate phosphatase [Desulfobacteraceae bacterium]|jgi:undecaprenyl-diphosphatase
MDIISALILGIIQGLTEFLPVSSSGHLVIFQKFLNIHEAELLLDITLHMGTLLAVFIFFRDDLKEMISETFGYLSGLITKKETLASIKDRPHALLSLWVVTGMIPTAVIALVFKDKLESLFGDPERAAWMLMITGVIVLVSKAMPSGYTKRKKVGLLSSLAVGVAQGMAITPGISRSGSTIVCGMLCGIDRELAGSFSFLLSIPAIMGSFVFKVADSNLGSIEIIPMVIGFFSAAITGFFALKLLMKMVKKGNFAWFAPYCWALGLAIIFYL